MRPASRLLAAVSSAGRALQPNAPTGLTGLRTHPAPRSALIYLYNATLDKLKRLPESSVYRQSSEALTRHRLSAVEGTANYQLKEWAERMREQVEQNEQTANRLGVEVKYLSDGRWFLHMEPVGVMEEDPDAERLPENQEIPEARRGQKIIEQITAIAHAEFRRGTELKKTEGFSTQTLESDAELTQLRERRAELEKDYDNYMTELRNWKPTDPSGLEGLWDPPKDAKHIKFEPEPSLTHEQVSEIENKIGAGLIEEVIQVAAGELELVDVMAESQAWEELEEKPAEGQWTYFERGSAAHTGQTQKP
ncbi:NADH-ubiquinone oxidoreductase-like protein [Phyllosticta capitalensis]|uniref:NADH-ubiquinone oxidoreductase-like protein n=1 Tax=Phyllosticta capitalensis TaxID=121624 RepID=A0ABR1Z1H1_9PEZI